MAYTVRRADAADLPALTQLYLTYGAELRECGLHYEINAAEVPAVLEARIKSRLFFVGLALQGGRAAGFILCSIAKIGREYLCDGGGQIGYVNDLYVAPAARRTGCADALLLTAKDWLRETGVHTLRLEVLSGNPGGKSFWEKAGGREVAAAYQMTL